MTHRSILNRTGVALSGKRRVSPRRAFVEHLESNTLVLVAGASGAGKSTFLDQLASGFLPHSIMSVLPAGCANWLQTNGKKVIGWGGGSIPPKGTRRIAGAVLHYDILSAFDTAVESYETDPTLALVNRAERIVIVDIRPGREALRAHLAERLTYRRVPPFLARLMGRSMATRAGAWLERFPDLHRLTGNRLAPRRVRDRQRWNDRYVLLRSLYQREDWLDSRYRQWDSYIKAAAGTRLQHAISVAPDEGMRIPSFRLTGVYVRE